MSRPVPRAASRVWDAGCLERPTRGGAECRAAAGGRGGKAFGVTQMIRQLRRHGFFQRPFLELLERSILPQQIFGLRIILAQFVHHVVSYGHCHLCSHAPGPLHRRLSSVVVRAGELLALHFFQFFPEPFGAENFPLFEGATCQRRQNRPDVSGCSGALLSVYLQRDVADFA